VTERGDLPRGKVPPHLRRNARRMRNDMTEAELKLWNELRAPRLMGLGFRRQMPIGRNIVDFACPEYRLVLEVDGNQHAENQTNDRVRTAYLEQQGWQVVRFRNDDVPYEIDNICTHIPQLIERIDDDQ
jgi:very-short-patch-repair endonuclease